MRRKRQIARQVEEKQRQRISRVPFWTKESVIRMWTALMSTKP